MSESSEASSIAGKTKPIRTVIVGVDTSETARRAAYAAAALANAYGARLHIVSALKSAEDRVVQGPGGDTWHIDHTAEIRAYLDDLSTNWPQLRTSVATAVGKPGDALIAEAERLDADVIVVGNRNMQGLSRVLGAVANDVAHKAPCDVYIVNTTG